MHSFGNKHNLPYGIRTVNSDFMSRRVKAPCLLKQISKDFLAFVLHCYFPCVLQDHFMHVSIAEGQGKAIAEILWEAYSLQLKFALKFSFALLLILFCLCQDTELCTRF